MDVPELMAAMATQLAQLPGIGGRAYYPPPNRIVHSPTIVIRQSNERPTTYEKARAGQQVVLANIDVTILVEKVNDREKPRDEAKIDALISPALDLFDMSDVGGSVNVRLPGLDGHVDRIWHTATVQRGSVKYGQQECYAAVITMDAKFKRVPEIITLEVAL
jgi:hypothetical protein